MYESNQLIDGWMDAPWLFDGCVAVAAEYCSKLVTVPSTLHACLGKVMRVYVVELLLISVYVLSVRRAVCACILVYMCHRVFVFIVACSGA